VCSAALAAILAAAGGIIRHNGGFPPRGAAKPKVSAAAEAEIPPLGGLTADYGGTNRRFGRQYRRIIRLMADYGGPDWARKGLIRSIKALRAQSGPPPPSGGGVIRPQGGTSRSEGRPGRRITVGGGIICRQHAQHAAAYPPPPTYYSGHKAGIIYRRH